MRPAPLECRARALTNDPCRHCGDRPAAVGRRGMCPACYALPWARALYPRDAVTRRGSGVANAAGSPDPEPCPYPPGTPGRLATYERRAAAGLALFCPDDFAYPEDEI